MKFLKLLLITWSLSLNAGLPPLPSPAGNAGKFLTNDGSKMSWGSATAVSSPFGVSFKFTGQTFSYNNGNSNAYYEQAMNVSFTPNSSITSETASSFFLEPGTYVINLHRFNMTTGNNSGGTGYYIRVILREKVSQASIVQATDISYGFPASTTSTQAPSLSYPTDAFFTVTSKKAYALYIGMYRNWITSPFSSNVTVSQGSSPFNFLIERVE